MAIFSGIPDYSQCPPVYSDRNAQGFRSGGAWLFSLGYLPQGGIITTTTIVSSSVPVTYRGQLGGNYVYSVGSPPVGATDIVIIS